MLLGQFGLAGLAAGGARLVGDDHDTPGDLVASEALMQVHLNIVGDQEDFVSGWPDPSYGCINLDLPQV
jgi:hypothetical protein